MSKNKIETREIKSLTQNLFVRASLDADRIMTLAELIESGVELDPIKITPDGRVIDGRTRIEAHELCKKASILCEVVPVTDEVEIISLAYQSNVGGALPPTRKDTEHTVAMLLDRKVSQREIADLLGLPPSLARKYIKGVQFRLNTLKFQRAAIAITEGMTLRDAANECNVDPEKLKQFISGTRQKKNVVTDAKKNLSALMKSSAMKASTILKHTIEAFEDGECTISQAREIIEHSLRLYDGAARRAQDWRKRLEAIAKPNDQKSVA